MMNPKNVRQRKIIRSACLNCGKPIISTRKRKSCSEACTWAIRKKREEEREEETGQPRPTDLYRPKPSAYDEAVARRAFADHDLGELNEEPLVMPNRTARGFMWD